MAFNGPMFWSPTFSFDPLDSFEVSGKVMIGIDIFLGTMGDCSAEHTDINLCTISVTISLMSCMFVSKAFGCTSRDPLLSGS